MARPRVIVLQQFQLEAPEENVGGTYTHVAHLEKFLKPRPIIIGMTRERKRARRGRYLYLPAPFPRRPLVVRYLLMLLFLAIRLRFSRCRELLFLCERKDYCLIPIIFGFPYILTLHGVGSPRPAGFSPRLYSMYLLEQICVARARATVCVDPGKTAELVSAGFSNVEFIANGVELASESSGTPSPLDNGQIIVGYAGRAGPEKQLKLMGDCLEALSGRLRVVLVTAGPLRREDFFSETQRKVDFRPLGVLPPAAIGELYGQIELCLLTSEFEGMPMFLLEGLAARRPFVAPDFPGIRWMAELSGAGVLSRLPVGEGSILDALNDYLDRRGEIRAHLSRASLADISVHRQISRLEDLIADQGSGSRKLNG